MDLTNIKGILGDRYMERFRIFYPSTLFEPAWEALRENRCPLCNNRLKVPRNGKIRYCKGVKHPKQFIIREETFQKLI